MIIILLISLLFPTVYLRVCKHFDCQLLSRKAILLFWITSFFCFLGSSYYELMEPNLFSKYGVNRHTPQQRLRSKNLGILNTNLGRWAYDEFDEKDQQQLRKYMQDFTLDQIILTDAYSSLFRVLILSLRDRHHLMIKLNIVFAIGLVQSYITSTALTRLNSPLNLPLNLRIKDIKSMLQLLSVILTLMVSFYRELCQMTQGQQSLLTIKRTIRAFQNQLQSQDQPGKRVSLLEAIQDLNGRLARLKKLIKPANVGVIKQIQ